MSSSMPVTALVVLLSRSAARCRLRKTIAPRSPEDKRKIVQIGDTSSKFRILDPPQVGNDLR